eukprot:CAMPEP_0175996074 /NCGR_PEP_ID=MMETSP0108-20121206/55467_1 /TAXON_ID=195067 ORGANISM="Goniomonas pacifica, Strain CCMP1869" /NCGR_SAMPLE_ID=MMETSP0108 /ASSEMBLY_ACC=CAM_ASM_000204 /LENGTH=137 /DNA_ID=CAMNT_0017328231 /DNA_START=83 /DNA_END=496 /DNA_ORIENTATION=-
MTGVQSVLVFIGPKFAMLTMTGVQSVLVFTIFLCKSAGRWMYMVWVCLIYFNIGANFAVFPTGTAMCFGPTYVGPNYGLVFSSNIVGAAVGATAIQKGVPVLHASGMLWIVGACSASAFLLALLFRIPKHTTKDATK